MIRHFWNKKQYLRMKPLIDFIGAPMGNSRIDHFGVLNISEYQGPFVSNYEGIYCKPEKVDDAVVEVLIKVPRCSIIVVDNQRPYDE